MGRARPAAVWCSDQLKRQLFAAQQAKLPLAHDIDRFRADPADGSRGNQRPPDFAPVLLGNADGWHGSMSPEGALRPDAGVYREKWAGATPAPTITDNGPEGGLKAAG